jgi:hypothetical protein
VHAHAARSHAGPGRAAGVSRKAAGGNYSRRDDAMRKILFGLVMVAAILSTASGCRSNKADGGTAVGGTPGCNCGH